MVGRLVSGLVGLLVGWSVGRLIVVVEVAVVVGSKASVSHVAFIVLELVVS